MTEVIVQVADEAATVQAGNRLGRCLLGGGVVWLRGELGTGKTTLSRGILRACGHEGHVKSPTYTLVEPYELPTLRVYHFDLYRVHDPEELEYMGFRDYLDPAALLLVEWPERGGDWVPVPDLEAALRRKGSGRELTLRACSPRGNDWLDRWNKCLESGGGP